MEVVPVPMLVCPHEGAPLASRGNALVCVHKHSFDRAREGYVNLLPVQDKASLDPGDSKEMVAARRRFLETDAYAPIAAAVADETLGLMGESEPGSPYAILDAGCGEGYYLQALAVALSAQARPAVVQLAGIDISKWAVRAAAKRAAPVAWVVASNRRPPFAADSIDLVLCLFGFPVWPGFASVQRADGHVLMVDPGPDHLEEMRAIIYPEVRRSAAAAPIATPGYEQVSERRLRATAMLTSQAIIADLLAMTPHGHRATLQGRAALSERTSLEVTIDVIRRVFRRTPT